MSNGAPQPSAPQVYILAALVIVGVSGIVGAGFAKDPAQVAGICTLIIVSLIGLLRGEQRSEQTAAKVEQVAVAASLAVVKVEEVKQDLASNTAETRETKEMVNGQKAALLAEIVCLKAEIADLKARLP